ncbi:MAG: phosphatidylglycerophosphatase A [Methanobacterium sp.]|nr:phosphatidylglycerophosphatase A [Methanobacterium sp.]
METETCLNDTLLTLEQGNLIIQREKGFLSISDSRKNGGIKIIRSIINYNPSYINKSAYNSTNNKNKDIEDFLNENDILEPAAIIRRRFNFKNCVNITTDDVTVILTMADDYNLGSTTIVILKEKFNETTLLKLYKTVVEAKITVLWDMGVINGFSDLINEGNDDSILLACGGREEAKGSIKVDDVRLQVAECVREATTKLMGKYGYPKNILDYIEDVGVSVEELVEAGMQLCVGVDKTPELNIKLKNQLLKSLEDLNVISLIIAGIRLEEDYAKHRVSGVDVEDDPAYLYSDEVLGLAIANQIAGTKAIFNFKRYDEEKPGIIGTLGPVLDDIFAGLVAGCMSKIFEE